MRTTCMRALLADAVDLEAYFQRIGYTGPRTDAASLETLAAIHRLHPSAIAFETLDALLKRPIILTAAALEQKLLHGGRGGWCFEQNLLLSRVLQSLGFGITGLAARLLWNRPAGEVRARTHMLLLVEGCAGGPHIADVGFGGLTLTGPLRLVPDVEQATPHEVFRLCHARDGTYILQVLLGDAWKPMYSFDLQPQVLPDYEVWNWHLCHHPESPFINNLMVARVTPERRYGLFNNRLSIHHLRGDSEQTMLTTSAELRETLAGPFNIRLPDDPQVDALLERLVNIDT
jgi:N-hydroxyarylamine O-acetyltransferase